MRQCINCMVLFVRPETIPITLTRAANAQEIGLRFCVYYDEVS